MSVADVSVAAAPTIFAFVLVAAVAKIALVAVKFASTETAVEAAVVAAVAVDTFVDNVACNAVMSVAAVPVTVVPVTASAEDSVLVATVLLANNVPSAAALLFAVATAVDDAVVATMRLLLRSATFAFAVDNVADVVETSAVLEAKVDVATASVD